MKKKKFLWFTDTHFDKVMPWTFASFILKINKEKPNGIFLTGDISNGLLIDFHLSILAKCISCPIYFVLGNHDMHFSSIEKIHLKIKKICEKYPNLIWITDTGIVSLNSDVALIGSEGWYDASNGKSEYLQFTIDWMLTKEFNTLPSIYHRILYWKKLANESANIILHNLNIAINNGYKTIYILTHFPPWKEATRNVGTWLEKFWLPYNVNLTLGQQLENIMINHTDINIIVLCGHTHCDSWIHVMKNVECKVQSSKYYGNMRNEEIIFI